MPKTVNVRVAWMECKLECNEKSNVTTQSQTLPFEKLSKKNVEIYQTIKQDEVLDRNGQIGS